MDIVRIHNIYKRAEPHQPENWLFKKPDLELVKRPAKDKDLSILRHSFLKGGYIFGTPGDRRSFDDIVLNGIRTSLELVLPKQLKMHVTRNFKGDRQIRALFICNELEYNLVVTDPQWEDALKRVSFGLYSIVELGLRDTDIILTISLGEPFGDGFCYKLVAAVIVLRDFGLSYAQL